MKKREIAFVGGSQLSAIGNVHRIAAQMDGTFELVGGCFSRNAQISRDTAAKWGLSAARTYSDIHELIDVEKGKLDAVAVLTPVFSHASIITALIEHGFNVISEKPLVASLSEAERLSNTLRRSDATLFVTFNYTGYPMVRELKHRINCGDLGEIKQIRLTMQQESYLRRGNDGEQVRPQSWRLEDREIPTVSLDLGMHVVHLQEFLVGQTPISIYSRMNSLGAFSQVIDDVEVCYRCKDGLLVHGWWSKAALGYSNGLSAEVFGTEGSAKWVQAEPEILRLRSRSGVESLIHRGTNGCGVANMPRYNRFKAGHPDGFIEAFANTYLDIATEMFADEPSGRGVTSAADFSTDQSLRLLSLLTSAVESAKSGCEVKVR